ncbi:MAG: class I SAM-dependent methyltransferase [Mobilicoccus sp.]|nr:class I SAM-dependent methyltransferase [Mobilicoccus sp.]
MTATTTPGFDGVAPAYDLMVGLSPGYHAQLRASARAFVESLPRRSAPLLLLDLGCGSGASTRALVTELDAAGLTYRLVGIDASAGMLAQAQRSTWRDVTFEHARAEDVPALLAERGWTPDGIFAAYLLRNVTERDAMLGGLAAHLAPGAPVLVHDYSVAGDPLARAAWTLLCWCIIVPLSVVLTRRPGLFVYLWRSVLDFDSTETVMQRFLRAGLTDVRTRRVPGWQGSMVHMVHGKAAA